MRGIKRDCDVENGYATACRILGDVYIQAQLEIAKLHKQYAEQLAQKDKQIASLSGQINVLEYDLEQCRKCSDDDREPKRDID